MVALGGCGAAGGEASADRESGVEGIRIGKVGDGELWEGCSGGAGFLLGVRGGSWELRGGREGGERG